MKKQFVIMVASGFLLTACSKSYNPVDPVDCSTSKSYAVDVSPIIQSYCAIGGCHASGSSNGPGALTTHQQVYNNRSSIRTAIVNGSMPQNNSLIASQKNTIICWIDNGSANN